jgi:hypothetical protein
VRVYLRCNRNLFVASIEPYRKVSFFTFLRLISVPLIYTSLSLCSCFLFVTFWATAFQSSVVRFLRNPYFEKRSLYCALLRQVSVSPHKQGRGFSSIRTCLAKNWCTVAISSLTFLRDRFLLRYKVCMMSLNGYQMGSTAHASVDGIDIVKSFGDNN